VNGDSPGHVADGVVLARDRDDRIGVSGLRGFGGESYYFAAHSRSIGHINTHHSPQHAVSSPHQVLIPPALAPGLGGSTAPIRRIGRWAQALRSRYGCSPAESFRPPPSDCESPQATGRMVQQQHLSVHGAASRGASAHRATAEQPPPGGAPGAATDQRATTAIGASPARWAPPGPPGDRRISLIGASRGGCVGRAGPFP